MANNQRETGSNGGGAPTAPQGHQAKTLTPSEIGQAVLTIVASLETLAEQSQRRVLESVRVQLGLMPSKEQQQQRQQPPQQRRGNGS